MPSPTTIKIPEKLKSRIATLAKAAGVPNVAAQLESSHKVKIDGIDQLALKAALDGFASIAFAAALGWGVAASAIAVALYQGFWTVIGVLAGGVLPPAEIASMTVVGGILLVGVSIRLLRLRDLPVADLLPAVVIAPLLTALISHFQ